MFPTLPSLKHSRGLNGGKSVRDQILVAALTPTLWPAETLTFVSNTVTQGGAGQSTKNEDHTDFLNFAQWL